MNVDTVRPDMWAARYRNAPDKALTVWINSTIEEFRLCPDARPFAFGVSEISLLVP